MSSHRRFLPVVVSVGATVGLYLLVVAVFEPGDRTYDFFLARSWVQMATTWVCALALTLLAARIPAYRRAQRLVLAATGGDCSWKSRPGVLSERRNAVRRCLAEQGAKGAAACAERLDSERKEGIRKFYEFVAVLSGALPALGLYGTLAGLGGSLFEAFSGAVGPETVQKFATALGTALDTTILAMVCAFPVYAFSWWLCRKESDLCELEGKYLQDALQREGLLVVTGEAPAGSDAPGAARPAAPATDAMCEAIRTMGQSIVAETRTALEKIVAASTEAYSRHLDRAMKEFVAVAQGCGAAVGEQVSAKLAEQVGAVVGRTVGDVVKVVEEHNGRASDNIVRELRRIERLLPNELVFRVSDDEAVK